MPILALVVTLLTAVPVTEASPAPTHSTLPKRSADLSPNELFSRRALRQARLLIQMRLLQLRDERLECIREALRRQLPAALWPELPSPSRGSSEPAVAATRCSQALKF
jgi:hypothetical protein